MKRSLVMPLAIGALALTLAVAGCDRGSETPAPSANPAAPAAPAASGAGTIAGSALGTAQAAGPFQVTLTTDPATPTEGKVRLVALVTRDGKAVPDAQIAVALSMPAMNMGGPKVELAHGQAGHYEATADLGMGGAWAAKITVKQGGETGEAVFGFTAMQK